MLYPINIGCTVKRHEQIGINAVVNARAGLQHLNSLSDQDIELRRDAHKIEDKKTQRIRIYQFNSKFCRRNLHRLNHLLSEYGD